MQTQIAKVVPIYKNFEKSLPINYRPVFLLPTFSKILEKSMYERMVSFVNKHSLLSNCQYGFQAKRSYEDAVYNLPNYIFISLDDNVDVVGLFPDVSKAFSSLSLKILLDKLYCYDFQVQAYIWLKNYLTDTFQFVSSGMQS